MKQTAEAVAKARFAETRDASGSALFYIALGKRSLLQAGPWLVIYPTYLFCETVSLRWAYFFMFFAFT